MTPQTSFLYAAEVVPERREALHDLLLSLNRAPGGVDAKNVLIPFARLHALHFARALIVTDLGAADRAVYGLSTTGLPDYLVLLGEVDGPEPAFRRELVRVAEPGLRALFAHCRDAPGAEDLWGWLGRHRLRSAANYVNWAGRTVQQVGEEQALRLRLERFFSNNAMSLHSMPPRAIRETLRNFVEEERRGGHLTLTPPAPTPIRWWLAEAAHLLGIPLLLLLMSPVLLFVLPFYLVALRRWEGADPAVAPSLDLAHASALAAIENTDVTNQFSVFGSLKPGRFRRWSMRFFLLLTDYAARHIYNRGGLARVQTIHFARWVPFDGGERMLFSSMYDGSLESYMDDFINKVGFGLNITFSGGIGYPRTRWLILDGCKDEQVFKRVLRRHQLPTEVWWSALPGLSAADMHRNGLIRDGISRTFMTDAEVRRWLQLF